MKTRTVAVTAGDANGIGAEVALKAAWKERGAGTRIVLVGHRVVWERAAKACGAELPEEWDLLAGGGPDVYTWDPGMGAAPRCAWGKVRKDAAVAAYGYILAATSAALNGRADAVVTAPINKEGFQAAGIPAPGHTELLAKLTGAKRYAMMLFGQRIRVVLATRHLPLRKVADALTREAVEEAIDMLAAGLAWMGWKAPRIGVCGLNPHAGDGGALGDEERRIVAPAVAACRKRGVRAEGPIAADAIFHRHLHGGFEGVVAMYHDQGLGPMKMDSFEDGVNLTLGLPIVRTSPDHGTAYDLAGKGAANPGSMVSALQWAKKLAARRNPWRTEG